MLRNRPQKVRREWEPEEDRKNYGAGDEECEQGQRVGHRCQEDGCYNCQKNCAGGEWSFGCVLGEKS
jgi:hypothetical protein